MTETAKSAEINKNKSPITVFVSDEVRERLLQRARVEELKLSDVVRRALKEYIEKETY